jgi:acyl-CoA thioesterase-1
LLALALAAASCGRSASPTAPGSTSPEASRRVIVVLGDSLAVSPSRTESFPAVLQTRLNAAHPGWTIRNEGIIGDTTSDGVRRINAALTADTGILVLELGANDGLRGDSIATIEANLGTMIERAQARSVRVLLCGMETLPFNGLNYTVEFHNLFPRVAARYSVPLVPFLLEGVALIPEFNLQDGIHPNAAGARRIADTVWPYLQPLVLQASATNYGT